MRYKVILLLAFFVSGTAFAGDEVSKLREMARTSEEYRDLSIDCLIEMKVDKAEGWGSDECLKYKLFADGSLQSFKAEIKQDTSSFNNHSKSKESSKRRIKRGLKQLLIIQQNMESIKYISETIRNAHKM